MGILSIIRKWDSIRKWTRIAAMELMILAAVLFAAIPVHAADGTSVDVSGSSEAASGMADTSDEIAGTSDDANAVTDNIIAEETDYYIKSLFVDITVHEDNVYDVVESYVYDFIQPHHGPVRKIPENHYRYYEDGTNSYVIAHVSDFQVTSPDANTDVSEEDGSYYIGSSDENYTGEHTYVMSYTYSITSPDPLKGTDELYYNIVGTGWACPIGSVSWQITMPSSFDAGKIGYSVGASGNAGYDLNLLNSSVNGLVITGSYHAPLHPYEGITIRCELPDGYFVFHSHSTAAWIVIAVLLLIPLIAILRNWKRSGRRAVPVVNFYPPKGMNPLDVEEIWNGTTEHKMALIPYLADKGYFRIEEPKKGKVRFRLEKNDFTELKNDERAFLEGMFPGKREIGTVSSVSDLEYHFRNTLDTVGAMHRESASRQIRGKGMQVLMYILAFLEMTICPAVYTAYVAYADDMSSALGFGMIAAAVMVSGMIFVYQKGKLQEYRKKSVVAMVICAAFLAGLFLFTWWLYSAAAALLMLCAGFLNFLAAGRVVYRTEENLKYYGDVLGYRNFIEKAELSQLRMLSQENPSYFYFTLAFAYVFGLESKWISQFEKYNIPVPEPTWYYGYRPFVFTTFREDFGHVMKASSTALNAVPPSESGGDTGGFSGGGFSGGGFSGGGSGGGGGGAW